MLAAWGVTHKGVVRQQNQDAFEYLLSESGTAAAGVVCDGMGGARAGNVASTLAVEVFCAALRGDPARWEGDPGGLMTQAAEEANAAVFQRAAADSECHGMGTTLVAALAFGGRAHVLNIGDSRAYHINQGGITRVTRDHSVVEDLVLRGELTPEQARQHPQKNLITRALGAEEQLRADLFDLPAGEGDYLLLCSDGLSNTVSDQELLFEALHGGGADSCCLRLLDIALSRGAPDNVTALLFQF